MILEERKFNKDNNSELFTSKVRAGSRTYYFDVKKTIKNDNYLIISESKKKAGDLPERHRIMVFEEDLRKFHNSLSEVLGFLNMNIE